MIGKTLVQQIRIIRRNYSNSIGKNKADWQQHKKSGLVKIIGKSVVNGFQYTKLK